MRSSHEPIIQGCSWRLLLSTPPSMSLCVSSLKAESYYCLHSLSVPLPGTEEAYPERAHPSGLFPTEPGLKTALRCQLSWQVVLLVERKILLLQSPDFLTHSGILPRGPKLLTLNPLAGWGDVEKLTVLCPEEFEHPGSSRAMVSYQRGDQRHQRPHRPPN